MATKEPKRGNGDVHSKTHTKANADSAATDEVKQRWELIFDIRVSRGYNLRMAGFYNAINNLALIATILGSAALFTDITNPILRISAGVMALAFALANIVLNAGIRAAFHQNMYRRYTLLLNFFEEEHSIKEMRQCFNKIEADEIYPVRVNLYTICQNQQAYVESLQHGKRWYADAYLHLKWYQRVLFMPCLPLLQSEAAVPAEEADTDSGAHDTTQSK